jgi:DNA-binding FadR family transcriptional regulator
MVDQFDTHTNLAPIRAQQVYERIVERIADEIRVGLLRAGERLPSERELAARLEVGRSSVREAIAALQLQGIVETRPGAGSFVAADAVERVRAGDGASAVAHDASPSALLDARALLEPGVARIAAARAARDATVEALLETMTDAADPAEPSARTAWSDADRRFHRQIAVMTANPVLVAMADHVAALMDQPLWRRLRDESIAVPGRTQLQLAEHRMIYEAIVAGEPDDAAFYAERHVARARRYMTLDDRPS